MATPKSRIVHKHFRLDALKLKRAQKLLEAATETETVERALDLAISEHERNRLTVEAHRSLPRAVSSSATSVARWPNRRCPFFLTLLCTSPHFVWDTEGPFS